MFRIMILEASGDENQLKNYFRNASHATSHYVLNDQLKSGFEYLTPNGLDTLINFWMTITPNNSAPNWQVHTSTRCYKMKM